MKVQAILAAIFATGVSALTWHFFPDVSLAVKILYVCTLGLFGFLILFQLLEKEQTPKALVSAEFWLGMLCPLLLAILLVERWGTLQGIATWMIPLSFLTLGFGFGKSEQCRLSGVSTPLPTPPSLEMVLLPLTCALAATFILVRAAPGYTCFPVAVNFYLGFTFSLFCYRLTPRERARVSLGGLAFPLAFCLSWFLGPDDKGIQLSSGLFFVFAYLDATFCPTNR